jgi:sugar phosphate isomerase/epimerase
VAGNGFDVDLSRRCVRRPGLALAIPTPDVQVHLPLALCSGAFSERLSKAARYGYDGVELLIARPQLLDANDIRQQVNACGLDIAAIATGALYRAEGLTLLCHDPNTSRRAADRLEELVVFAADAGVPLVTIGAFRGWLSWAGGAAAREQLLRLLASAASVAHERGVRLVLEPLNRYESDVCNNVQETLAFIEEAGQESLGLLLDTFHMNIEESDMTEAIRQGENSSRLWHVHVGDSNRRPPGQGHLDFGTLLRTMADVGYCGFLSAELLGGADPDLAAEATIQHLRPLLDAV